MEYFRTLIIALLFQSLEPVRLFVFLKEQFYIYQGCISFNNNNNDTNNNTINIAKYYYFSK